METTGEKMRVEFAIKTPVKDRTEIQHIWLTKHYGGVREYLLTMGDFKEDNCSLCNPDTICKEHKLAQRKIIMEIKDGLEELDTEENKVENCQGGLWLTSMGRIVLDDHGYEAFSEPGDKKLMDKKEISFGIPIKEFQCRLMDALQGEKAI